MRAPGLKPSQLAELLRLRRKGEVAEGDSQKALESLRGLATETQNVTGEIQTELSDTPTYKRPQKEGVSKGTMGFGIGLGVLGALANVRDPENLTGTVIGGQAQIKEQEHAEALDTLRERMAADREAKSNKVQGLQAKLGGIGAQRDVVLTDLDVSGRKALDIGSELYRREQDAQGQANWQTAFNHQVTQDGILNTLRNKEETRQQARFDLDKKLTENPYAFIDQQAEALKGNFGGDKDKARAAILAPLMNGLTEQELNKYQLAEIKEFAKILPEKIAFQKWSWEQEKKESAARIAAHNRSNRGQAGPTIADFRFGQTVKGIDSLTGKIRDAESTLVGEDAKYKDVTDKSFANSRSNVKNQIAAWKRELFGMQNEANKLQPGAYDTSWVMKDPDLAAAIRKMLNPLGG